MPKICNKCNQMKSLLSFHRDMGKKDGRTGKCSLCCSLDSLEKYKSRSKGDIEDRIRKDRSYRCKYPGRALWHDARRRAKLIKVPFTITVEDIKVTEKCPVLGIPLFSGFRKMCDNSLTLDRIIPERGYVPGNICVMSNKANRIKNDGTIEEHMKVVDWMKEKYIILIQASLEATPE